MFDYRKDRFSLKPAKVKIISVGLVLVIIFTILSGYMVRQYYSKLEEQRRSNLKQIVEIGRNAIEPILALYRSNKISKDEALLQIRNHVREMVYEDEESRNYIFMSSYDGIMLVQPFEPQKEMTDMWDLKDANGVYIIRELVKTAQSENKAGYVSYFYIRPNQKQAEEKISYVIGIPELDCYIGTGKYMTDIRKAERNYIISIGSLAFSLIALLVFLVLSSLREVQRQNLLLQREYEALVHTQEEKELLQHQLLHSQKMEAIGTLAGGIAHDFNNILGIIMGSAQLAQYDLEEGSEASEELSVIIDSSKRARDLTMKLLTFARKDKPDKSMRRIKSIFDNIRGILERSLSKNIKVITSAKEDISIFCDEGQIYQALMNLCTNAADAMPSGGHLTIECEEVLFPEGKCEICGEELVGKHCVIQVLDTGIGIDEDVISRVTDPFFTTKGVGKGTGLGMSVTLGIVNNHDGHMHILSEPKKGTCVKIYLPMGEGQEKEAAEPSGVVKDYSGNETILVIDDEKPLLEMAGRFLAKKGYDAILATGGKQGIELYTENMDKISIVVLDLMMPEIDGADVFRELKEINPDIRVIFASGYSINGQAQQLIGEGNHRFVQKPFDVEELCATIREVIDGGK